jgi:transcriptional regulator with GAF, ATPase, and Fis domain
MSVRCHGPFITLHCGAVPDTLLEDELYGHVKGAFTGAVANRPGCFELADGGTLLLDEIGTMSFPLQSKLLRVLQDLEVRRLGDSRCRRVDVRVVAATNSDLKTLVDKGGFRGDLYYRLSVFPITLPALRQRGGDVLILARHFANRIGIKLGTGPRRLTPETEAKLLRCSWPGNVRQLENTIERAVVMCQDRECIDAADIVLDTGVGGVEEPVELPQVVIPEQGICFDSVVSQLERQLILKSLEISGGNKKQAAGLLQMKRTTLIEKLKRLNQPPRAS